MASLRINLQTGQKRTFLFFNPAIISNLACKVQIINNGFIIHGFIMSHGLEYLFYFIRFKMAL